MTRGLCYQCAVAGYTLTLWMKVETHCSQSIAIVSSQPTAVLVYQAGTLYFRFRKTGSIWELVAEGVVVGRWHHVTVTWSTKSGLSLYIDATLAARCDVYSHTVGQRSQVKGHMTPTNTGNNAVCKEHTIDRQHDNEKTRGSAIAEEPRDALRQLKYYGRFVTELLTRSSANPQEPCEHTVS